MDAERGEVGEAGKPSHWSDEQQLRAQRCRLAFNKSTAMSDFMDSVAKQLEKKRIDMKARREKKRKKQKIAKFVHKMSTITEQDVMATTMMRLLI